MSFKNYDDELPKIKASKTRSEKSFHRHIFFGGSTKFFNSQVKNATNPRGSKQVVVKMISNLPKSSVKRCIDYTLQNAHDGLCVNEKGERIGSDEVMREWGKDFGTNKNSRDAWHLVFSIKEPIDDERKLKALQASVR